MSQGHALACLQRQSKESTPSNTPSHKYQVLKLLTG